MAKRFKAIGSRRNYREHAAERKMVKIKEQICYTQGEGGLV
jgi:hypothetical protein